MILVNCKPLKKRLKRKREALALSETEVGPNELSREKKISESLTPFLEGFQQERDPFRKKLLKLEEASESSTPLLDLVQRLEESQQERDRFKGDFLEQKKLNEALARRLEAFQQKTGNAARESFSFRPPILPETLPWEIQTGQNTFQDFLNNFPPRDLEVWQEAPQQFPVFRTLNEGLLWRIGEQQRNRFQSNDPRNMNGYGQPNGFNFEAFR